MTDDSLIGHELPIVPKTSHPVLWTGLCTAALLVVVMLGALVAANRFPSLESYAIERNAAFGALFVVVMLLPVLRFLNRPRQMFASAMIGWVLFAGGYNLVGFYFRDLFDVLRTPFQALVEGTAAYGVLAGISWVVGMLLHARRHPIAAERKGSRHVTPHIR
jgi:hypothetical protein